VLRDLDAVCDDVARSLDFIIQAVLLERIRCYYDTLIRNVSYDLKAGAAVNAPDRTQINAQHDLFPILGKGSPKETIESHHHHLTIFSSAPNERQLDSSAVAQGLALLGPKL
jgi:hypothetical protein